ncbi:MAG: hypothetical protein JXQ30_04565 [Spirochaetes bacterium]|nr:hypothetical protein [Spirochaetota bacterium]
MGDIDDEKTQSPFDIESEDETIALSMDELDGILSEAEIVSDTQKKGQAVAEEVSEPEGGEPGLDDLDLGGTEDIDLDDSDLGEPGLDDLDLGGTEDIDLESAGDTGSGPEDEFDISGEIDELSSKDLEDIELEVGDVDTIVQDLEEELEQEGEIDMPGSEAEEISMEDMGTQPSESEEGPLDLGEGEEIGELDLDELDLGEDELGEPGIEEDIEDIDLTEAPVLGERDEKLEGFVLEDQEAFREAGIEGIEDEIKDLELPDLEDEEIEMPEDEFQPSQPEGEEALEEPSEEVVLTAEDEEILSKDIDLEGEEVVTVTGEELSRMEEEPGVDSALLDEVAGILKYMDTLLGNLPQKKIKEFAASSYYERYKDLFEKLGIK